MRHPVRHPGLPLLVLCWLGLQLAAVADPIAMVEELAVTAHGPDSPLDPRNLDAGFPLRIQDAWILPHGSQTLSLAVGAFNLTGEDAEEYLNIEIHQGVAPRWQVGWTGRLDNIKGDSDGSTAAEVVYVLQRERPRQAGLIGKLQLELGATNDNARVTLMGGTSYPVSNCWRMHFNGYVRLQEQEGTAARQQINGALLGFSTDLKGLFGQPAAGMVAFNWEEHFFRSRKDHLRLDAGLRIKGDGPWLWYGGIGTDLQREPGVERPLRMITGVTWDISS